MTTRVSSGGSCVREIAELLARQRALAELELSAGEIHACAREIGLIGDHSLEREHGLLRPTSIERSDTEQVVELRSACERGLVIGKQCVGFAGFPSSCSLFASARTLAESGDGTRLARAGGASAGAVGTSSSGVPAEAVAHEKIHAHAHAAETHRCIRLPFHRTERQEVSKNATGRRDSGHTLSPVSLQHSRALLQKNNASPAASAPRNCRLMASLFRRADTLT